MYNLVYLNNFSKTHIHSLFWLFVDNNDSYLKQLISNKFLDNNKKLSYDKNSINLSLLSFQIVKDENKLSLEMNKYFNSLKSYNKNIDTFFKNKRIVLVGPADYVDNSKLIDSYDIIARINKGYNMKNTGKHGSRTDIMYHVVNQHPENGGPLTYSKDVPIRFCYPILTLSEKSSFKDIGTLRDYYSIFQDLENGKLKFKEFSIINKDKYLSHEETLNSRPNSGLSAILDILSFDIKELYITGFTLFQTNYATSYRNKVDNNKDTGTQALNRMKDAGHHNQDEAKNAYKKYIITDKRVKVDKILLDILNN